MTATPPCCWARRNYLAETRNFDGTVHFIFQPAEEGVGGAQAMVKDGLFERFPCERSSACTTGPGLPVGKFAIRPGPAMAGGAFFDINITGKGAHGARPEQSIDPVLVACQIVTALQAIVSRNVCAARHGGDQRHPDPCRRRLQRHPADAPCCAAPCAPCKPRRWR